jgi:prepilin-type N-terminal cleavage/methylation domain-containing protein
MMRRKRGFTLVELLMVSAVMALLATTLAALANTVQVANEQQMGRGLSLQHAQVTIERIERTLQGATANEQFPGFIVISETLGGSTFPDTLVVWKPKGSPANPTGLPRVNELVVFAPADGDPTRLLELRASSDNSQVPPVANTNDWKFLLSMLKTAAYSSTSSDAAVLTDLIRTAEVTNASGQSAGRRSCVRFEQVLRPSAAEWQAYKAGSVSWASLPWAQGVYGTKSGQRQALCRIELQLRPGDIELHDKQLAIPFFGSSAIYYQLKR